MAEFRVMERDALAEPRAAYKPLRGQAALDGRGTRDAFLASLRSAGRYKYGRYNGLPLRYAGGKSLAVGHVVENLPTRLSRVVSPFIGGGSVEIACARELGVPVQGYDVFDVLTNYWEVQLSALYACSSSSYSRFRSSSLMLRTVCTKPMWLNACGKLPSARPLAGSCISAKRPSGLAVS